MLRRLSIRNYLLIEQLELDLDKGLTVLTGETGSGKSIIIGALGLAMGERSDAGIARDASARCVIEIEFDLKGLSLEPWFTTEELPYERYTILRRQFDPGGRSRAFVNDTPVRLEQLRALGERLVHVHSQHQTLLLQDAAFQLGLVDHFADQAREVRAFGERHAAWKIVQTELVALREQESRAQGELDYLRFQLNELEEAALIQGEQSTLERDLSRAEHAEELIQALRSLEEGLQGERGTLAQLAMLRQLLAKPARVDTAVQTLLDRLGSASIELKDIAGEAERTAAQVGLDPAEALRLRERLDLLLRLQQKHRVKDVEALIALRDELRERTGRIGSLAERIEALGVRERTLADEVLSAAKVISAQRMKAMGPLAARVEKLLKELGMPHAVFRFDHQTGEPGPAGIDRVRALFSANKDRAPGPLDKVASGGELSRAMLALLSLSAASQELPTVIFDEIDSGVSGEVADRVGTLLAQMGKERQVIAITHLPQIASKAGQHLLVSKELVEDVTRTHIRPLDAEQRVQALAQMLSGRKTGKAAVENARELLKGK